MTPPNSPCDQSPLSPGPLLVCLLEKTPIEFIKTPFFVCLFAYLFELTQLVLAWELQNTLPTLIKAYAPSFVFQSVLCLDLSVWPLGAYLVLP